MTATVADLLDRAADLLERDGWCQGSLDNADGQRCVMGAVYAARDDLVWSNDLASERSLSVTHQATDALFDAIGWNIPEWNDSEQTSFEDVLSLLRGVAAEQRGLRPEPEPEPPVLPVDQQQAAGLWGWMVMP
jgi:hypothetical protein